MITKRAKENKQRDNRPDRWFGRSRRRILSYPDAPILARAFVVGIFVGVLLGAGAVSAGVAEGDVSFDKSFDNSTYTVETDPSDLDVSVSVNDDGVSIEPEEFGTTSVYVETGIGLNATTDLSTSVNLQMFPSSTESEVYIGAFDEDFSVGSQTDRAKWGLAAKSTSGSQLVEIYEWGANSSETVSEQKIGEYVNPPRRVDLSIDFGAEYVEIQSDDGVIDANVSAPQYAYFADTTGIRARLSPGEWKQTGSVSDSGTYVSVDTAENGDVAVADYTDDEALIYRDMSLKKTLSDMGDSATSVAYSDDGSELAVGSRDSDIYIYNTSDYSLKTTLGNPGNNVNDVEYHSGLLYAVARTSGADNLFVYDSSDYSLSHSQTLSVTNPRSISINSDGTQAAIGTQAPNILIYDLAGYSKNTTLSDASNSVESVEYSGDGRLAAATSSNSNAYIYEKDYTLQDILAEGSSASESVDFNGSELAVGYGAGQIRIYSAQNTLKSSISAGATSINGLKFDAGGLYAANDSAALSRYERISGEGLDLSSFIGGFGGGGGSIFPIAGLPGSGRAQMFGAVVIIGLIVWGWRD